MNAENLYNTMYAAPIEGLERCYTIQEIAGHLNISISSTRKLVAAGYLRPKGRILIFNGIV